MLIPGVFSFCVAGFYIFFFLLTAQQAVYASQEIAMFERSLRFNPDNLRVRTSLGLALAKKELFAEAEEQFRRVLGADPLNARARIGLGKALCDQGRFWDGIREYEKIQDAGALEELLKDNLKFTYGILIQKYQALREREPRNPQVYYSLGVIYSKMNNPSEAIRHYEKSVELDPDFKNALFNLASSLEAAGDGERAAGYYQRMLQLKGTKDDLDDYASSHLAVIQERLTKPHSDDFK
jgi:tetratricopeptide (TPR) repeat protein